MYLQGSIISSKQEVYDVSLSNYNLHDLWQTYLTERTGHKYLPSQMSGALCSTIYCISFPTAYGSRKEWNYKIL